MKRKPKSRSSLHEGLETILVTGASGRLGTALVPLLLDCGATVVGCDVRKPRTSLAGKRGVFTFERCDLTSPHHIQNLFEKYRFDAVIHLAALLPKEEVTPGDLFRHNVVATRQLVSAGLKAGVKRCVFSSSMTVYGMPQYLPVDEAHSREPMNFYGSTKLMGEELVKHLCAEAGAGYTILRFPGMFSPERHEGAVCHFVRRALQSEPIELTAEKPTPWDIILVDDAAAVIRDCVYASKNTSGAFNVGYGERVSLPIVARTIKRITRSSSKIVNRTGVTHPPFYFDTNKMKKVLGVRLPSLGVRLKEYIDIVRDAETAQ